MRKANNILKTKSFLSLNFELLIWIAALGFLLIIDPSVDHVSICPLSLLNFEFCPGCGLGRSIAFLFNGDLALSFETHPLGLIALGVICYRIISLIIKNFTTQKTTTL